MFKQGILDIFSIRKGKHNIIVINGIWFSYVRFVYVINIANAYYTGKTCKACVIYTVQCGVITLIELVGQSEKKYADNKHVFHSNGRQWMILVLVHIICKIVYKNRKVTKCLSIAYLCKINSRWHQRNANKRIESKWNVYNVLLFISMCIETSTGGFVDINVSYMRLIETFYWIFMKPKFTHQLNRTLKCDFYSSCQFDWWYLTFNFRFQLICSHYYPIQQVLNKNQFIIIW